MDNGGDSDPGEGEAETGSECPGGGEGSEESGGGGGSEGSGASSQGACVLLIDEDGLDNDLQAVEQAARWHGVPPDALINDDRPSEVGNPHFLWNERFAGDVVRLPTGQVDDEGWFALPEALPWSLADFVAGTVRQSQLDKIVGVMPLRNQDLAALVGQTCVAVVYDSDISMNYRPILANLQGARLGLFTFTVLAFEVPGSLPESKSDTSLFDLWLRIEPPAIGVAAHHVAVRDHEPDAVEILEARYDPVTRELVVRGESDLAPEALMTVSVDGPDTGSKPGIHPSVVERLVPFAKGCYALRLPVEENLRGRRLVISTDEGGAYNVTIH